MFNFVMMEKANSRMNDFVKNAPESKQKIPVLTVIS